MEELNYLDNRTLQFGQTRNGSTLSSLESSVTELAVGSIRYSIRSIKAAVNYLCYKSHNLQLFKRPTCNG